ncbi:MAG: hypothetical protein ONB30_09890 [candidate division KSB1 bacterium]|nr:hypothetical protein [candidate division KSB1 bacterium]
MSMRRSERVIGALWAVGALLVLGATGCDTGVEVSPQPGILRVTLQSDPADTSIVIVKDTVRVAEGDSFGVTVYQGKVYNDSAFALLYTNPRAYQQQDVVYNIIKRVGGQYHKFTIYESHVPPFSYDKITFGMTPRILRLGTFEIPVKAPTDISPFVELPVALHVEENGVTEVEVRIRPFRSVRRYRDSYLFIPDVEVVAVKNL